MEEAYKEYVLKFACYCNRWNFSVNGEWHLESFDNLWLAEKVARECVDKLVSVKN